MQSMSECYKPPAAAAPPTKSRQHNAGPDGLMRSTALDDPSLNLCGQPAGALADYA